MCEDAKNLKIEESMEFRYPLESILYLLLSEKDAVSLQWGHVLSLTVFRHGYS